MFKAIIIYEQKFSFYPQDRFAQAEIFGHKNN